MVVDKYAGRCLDVGSIPTGSIYNFGRLLKRLKRPCWKRGRRVTACVGSNPMSSVEKNNYFGDATNVVSFLLIKRNKASSYYELLALLFKLIIRYYFYLFYLKIYLLSCLSIYH